MIETLDSIDTQVLIFLNSFRGSFWDSFFALFSGKFIWGPLYATLIYLFFRNYDWKKALIFIIAVIVCITLADQTCSHIIRPFIQRLRPSNADNPISAMVYTVAGHVAGGRYGFPSCHAANSFALAMMVTLLVRRTWLSIFFFLWAIVNSYSRIYLAAHYPGDLLAGAIIGLLYGFLMSWVALSLTNEKKSKHQRTNEPAGIVLYTGVLTIVIIILLSFHK